VQIYNAKDYELIYENPEHTIESKLPGESVDINFTGIDSSVSKFEGIEMVDDLFVKVTHRSLKDNDRVICRFGFNTSFLKRGPGNTLYI
jgi:hypothetical protein